MGIVLCLVRSFFVVMGYKLVDEMVHVLLPEHDEVIEAFLLECLDEPFDEGIGVG